MSAIISGNLGAGFAKHLFPLIGAYGTTALRVSIAALLMGTIIRPWPKRQSLTPMPALFAYGAVLGMMNLCFYQAIARIPLGIAIGIEVLGPIAVTVFTSRSSRDFLWLALALTGLALLLPIRAHQMIDPAGVAFAFGAATCWAVYILTGKRVSATLGSAGVAYGLIVAAIITFPIGLAKCGARLFEPGVLVAGFGIALLSSAIPYTLEMAAMRRLSTQVFSIILSGSPAVGAVVGVLLLGEKLILSQWLAILCIMLAAGGSALAPGRTRQ